MKAVRNASGALRELVKLIPPTANLVKDGDVVETPSSRLRVDNVVLVKPGEKVPVSLGAYLSLDRAHSSTCMSAVL